MAVERVGIIGGSGLYQMDGFEVEEERPVRTPFGDPSDTVLIGRLNGKPVVFLPRHGRGHRLSPSEINYRANIYAMKMMGVTQIVSVSAVGSLREEIKPGHFVLVSQYIDRTKARPSTFFENGIVAHVSLADPVCSRLGVHIANGCKEKGIPFHANGTYVCMEGPAFSTRAESHMYRSWGAHVIGMTSLQEAKLAREAEMCYATIALATDYDCWKEDEAHVDVEMVVATMKQNVTNAKAVLGYVIDHLTHDDCRCHHAVKGAIMTDPMAFPEEAKRRLAPIIGKYLK